MIELSLKEKKLLYLLDFNARTPYSLLAKQLKMSKRGVEYMLKNLEKKKVILSYVPVFDITKQGYFYFRIFIKFRDMSKELRKQIEEYILNTKEMGWAIWAYGIYDLGLNMWARTVTEFKQIINKFYFKFDKYIVIRTESIGTAVIFYKNRYLLQNKDYENIIIGEKSQGMDIDKTDQKIIEELIKNSRGKITDIAKNIKIDPKVIAYRIKRLQREKIFLATRPGIDHEILGKTYYKIFFYINNVDEKKLKQLELFIEQDYRVTYIVKAMGTCDLDVELIVDNAEHLQNFIESIYENFPNTIRDYQTLIFTKTIKAKFFYD